MKVLVVGSGGREHAIIRKLKESKRVSEIFCAPGNGGISKDAQIINIAATDISGMVRLAKEISADLVFVAPDDPLAMGMVDALEKEGIRSFGPDAKAAAIEGSKVFSKNLMKKYNIPTAKYEVFDNSDSAVEYIKENNTFPIVVKADGLALGKGVIIASDFEEASGAVKAIMEDKVFGESGNNIVIEEFITGPEVSVLAFTDGKTVVPMVSSKDHKRALDGDKGLNTGGMGTISPNPHYSVETAKECMEKIFLPTVNAMVKEGRKFKGCLYFGLMLTEDGAKVIEYNCRFGDPEAQVVLPRLKIDFLDVIDAVIDERLDEISIEWSDDACACVMMASKGYPGSYQKGVEINGLNGDGQVDGAVIFHSGTLVKDGKFLTNGGRVLGVTGKGETLDDALSAAYSAVSKISFEGAQYRSDIGKII